MLKSILYKEWLKIRKVSWLSLIVGLAFVIGVYLTVRHDLMVSNAADYWQNIVNGGFIYFSILEFIPLIIGLVIGTAQFVPEIKDKRIKLTLHLPLNEETVVLKMAGFGLAVVVIIFFIIYLAFHLIGLFYFPIEIVSMAGLTFLPWLLAGIAAYLLSAFVILEPLWKYRIFYILFGAAFIQLFFKSSLAGAYQPVIWLFVVLIALSSISTLLSIYRFRKGVM